MRDGAVGAARMKPSIRDIFLATFVVALGLLAWLSAATINQQQRELSEAKNQLASEEFDALQLASEQKYRVPGFVFLHSSSLRFISFIK